MILRQAIHRIINRVKSMKALIQKNQTIQKAIKKILSFSSMFLLFFVHPAQAAYQMNMHYGVTPMSHKIFGLHMFAIWICVSIGVIVYGVMIYSIIHYRKSKGAKAAHFHHNTALEVFWTVIPFVLLVILAIPATQVLSQMEDTKNADLTIKVTGYQWKWQYEYLGQGIQYFSNISTPIQQIYGDQKKGEWYLLEVDKPLVVPIHKKIRFLVTSNDVIHAWWVPDLGIKRDAIPGFIHESWARIDKPGIYRGQCAELCGVNHGFMPIVVRAVSDEEYQQWKTQEANNEAKALIQNNGALVAPEAGISKATTSSENVTQTALPAPTVKSMEVLMAEGEEQYGKYCAVCHKQDGTGMPPVFPALKGSSVATGQPITRHIQLVLTGVPGTAMQAFSNQLSDNELAAIVTYERNAWGNNTGDTIQAADVAAVRQSIEHPPVVIVQHEKINEVKP